MNDTIFLKRVCKSKLDFCPLEPKYKDWLKATESWLTHFKHDICKELAKILETLTRVYFIFPKTIFGGGGEACSIEKN